MERTSLTRNLLIMAAILPIAFAANVVRVMVLILVTYHLGDEAGQGFLHGFAGIMLFVIGLLFLFVLDWVLGFIFPDRPRASQAGGKS
jgi:exosortase/archaeosortase family protein